ncbi:DUF262 domain-containing protein [Flavobacterium sp. ANB]|uniref:DUF262 domain-containing protein n=1 Tax=unclassified Flavobacterium TaxID=196869 RepID=UPI0012B86C17|nr:MULTISPECIES: DUF262 domain-containing protein [unclassified Flavobacterium]MBF4517758.1 DUF262 domain-containing protein [Flavobacterium sp. ANB]MTD70485.1 DUF262 domain-containing protein [Flavobacterium sp. LC2016-13]
MERVDYQSLIIQDIINLKNLDELNLNPWYQRRSVWNDSQKSYLINTLFERKPIPAIYIRHSLDLELGKSIKEVVDGQQRSRAILSYCNNEFSAIHPETQKRVKYENLSKAQKQNFLLTPVPVGYLQGANDSDVIDIFARINSVSKTLNAQEKRNANFSGEFKQFAVRQSVIRLEFWRNYGIFTPTDISRMTEVQFISDLIINLIKGVIGYTSASINKIYKLYDLEFNQSEEISIRLNKIFETLIKLDPESIKNTIFNRPPLLLSLMIVIDSLDKIDTKKIAKGLFEIDSIFLMDNVDDKSKDDIDFTAALAATTQSVISRKVRDSYIKKFVS